MFRMLLYTQLGEVMHELAEGIIRDDWLCECCWSLESLSLDNGSEVARIADISKAGSNFGAWNSTYSNWKKKMREMLTRQPEAHTGNYLAKRIAANASHSGLVNPLLTLSKGTSSCIYFVLRKICGWRLHMSISFLTPWILYIAICCMVSYKIQNCQQA